MPYNTMNQFCTAGHYGQLAPSVEYTKTETMKVKHAALLQQCWSEDTYYQLYVIRAESQRLHVLTHYQYAKEMADRDDHAIATSYTNFAF